MYGKKKATKKAAKKVAGKMSAKMMAGSAGKNMAGRAIAARLQQRKKAARKK